MAFKVTHHNGTVFTGIIVDGDMDGFFIATTHGVAPHYCDWFNVKSVERLF